MEGLAVMLEAMFRGRRIDRHAADGIENLCDGGVVAVIMAGMVAMAAAAGGSRGHGSSGRLAGTTASAVSLFVVMMPVIRVAHFHAPVLDSVLQPIPGKGI
ncbi:hypothetical protein GCM10010987_60920 [Bradyrhizobium guangdongense]|uniref:Uncharacterized protein n=1 Tax=Bradyrhizobium guangdongense TaxID=1325090 RepID=A0AA88BBH6_9BRAD|nr:hypothetical protein GCM10010987_60920 [Bradyrhizobium guangdongense]